MFRKMTALLICLLLLTCLIIPVFAQSLSFIMDEAGLLLPEEIVALEEKAAQLETYYGIHAVVLTVDSLYGSSAQDYADDYYDNGGYGEDGVLFLLAMTEREWYITTCGSVSHALTDYGIQQVGNDVVSFLAEEQWYDGFSYFLECLPNYLDAYRHSEPIDGYADYSGDYYHGDRDEVVYYEEEYTPSFLVSLLCGIVIAGIAVLVMRLSMNTKRAQRNASGYIKDGSWHLTQHSDLFLYSNVTKQRKQETPKSTGGGSSVHRSSGGRRHGGGGGRF